MDFRHSITVPFPNSSDFGHLFSKYVLKPNFWGFECLKFEPNVWFSDTKRCLKSKLTKVQILDKFGFQEFGFETLNCIAIGLVKILSCVLRKEL